MTSKLQINKKLTHGNSPLTISYELNNNNL